MCYHNLYLLRYIETYVALRVTKLAKDNVIDELMWPSFKDGRFITIKHLFVMLNRVHGKEDSIFKKEVLWSNRYIEKE